MVTTTELMKEKGWVFKPYFRAWTWIKYNKKGDEVARFNSDFSESIDDGATWHRDLQACVKEAARSNH